MAKTLREKLGTLFKANIQGTRPSSSDARQTLQEQAQALDKAIDAALQAGQQIQARQFLHQLNRIQAYLENPNQPSPAQDDVDDLIQQDTAHLTAEMDDAAQAQAIEDDLAARRSRLAK